MPPILIPLVYLYAFLREIRDLFADPKYRGLLILVGMLLITGTAFYMRSEHWSLVDAFYFSVATLATVGYGDLTPTTTGGKIFTTIYIFMGLSIFLALVNMLAKDREQIMQRRAKEVEERKDD